MIRLTKKAYEFIENVVGEVIGESGIEGASLSDDGDNPFLHLVIIPIEADKRLVVRTCNELFHALRLLPPSKNLALGEFGDYCQVVCCGSSSEECYVASFNHPAVFELKASDPECRFILKNWRDLNDAEEGAETEAEEAAMQELIDGIKAGRLKSKSPDGYLVLKTEFYNAIEAGKKKVEYRDFSEYNLKRIIGLKTIRFNLGYAKDAKRMRWEVKKVVLLDGDDNECNPFNVPDDFWPTTIAIHLGKRID